jgi:putative ABC transport system substrate-binding protein
VRISLLLLVLLRSPHANQSGAILIDAVELVGLRAECDFHISHCNVPTVAARRATSTIPIVMVSVGDPVGSGFIASLARLGNNITGLSAVSVDLSTKLMELFAELVPGMKRVGVVQNSNNPGTAMLLR